MRTSKIMAQPINIDDLLNAHVVESQVKFKVR